MSTTESRTCKMKLLDKGSGYADIESYNVRNGLAFVNIIIIDVPFDI